LPVSFFGNLDVLQSSAWIADRPPEAPFAYVVTPDADHRALPAHLLAHYLAPASGSRSWGCRPSGCHP
jgi:hypothetical protein